MAKALSVNTSLEHLSMKHNYLQDDFAISIIQSLRGNNLTLTYLNLNNNYISIRHIINIESLVKTNKMKES